MIALIKLRRLFFYLSLSLILIGVQALFPASAFAASGVVGTGTPSSCTENAFNTVLNNVQASGGGTITFDCGGSPFAIIFTAQKSISADVELDGAGLITLSGGNATSLFQVFSGHTLTLTSISLSHGHGTFGALQNFGHLFVNHSQILNNDSTNSGGGVDNYGDLHLTNAVVSNNNAAQNGGGIFTDAGTVAITDTEFSGNTAASDGGAIAVSNAGILTVSGSQFSINSVSGVYAQGGAISSSGALTVTQSTFSLNHSSRGGGLSVLDGSALVTRTVFDTNYSAYGGGIRQEGGDLSVTDVSFVHNGYTATGLEVNTGGGAISWSNGTATLNGVTMSDNWATYGGGFDHDLGSATLTNVTIDGNNALGGGGFDQGGGSLSLVNDTITHNAATFFAGGISNRAGSLTLLNTLLSANINPNNDQSANCYKPVAGSFNLSSDSTCAFGTGRDNVDPLLGPLANNGGFAKTELLRKNSPAIDDGTDVGCPLTDQRGVSRPQGQACDVGAVEVTPADLLLKVYLPYATR
jgi:predicted outer membrane repeat protein